MTKVILIVLSLPPVINVIVFFKWTLGPLDQLRYAGAEVVTHQGLLLILGVVVLTTKMLA